jgi:aspartate/glutamate racemase
MTEEIIEETAAALQSDWGLQLPDIVSEETILRQLAHRVEVLIDRGGETFFQLMYRLDIPEKKLKEVMHEADVAERVARLIYNRQLQKIITRRELSRKEESPDPDLQW